MRPSIADLRANLSYDPESGSIRWIMSGYGRDLSAEAGSVKDGKTGERSISFMKTSISAGIVAWALHYGEYPERFLVYENGDKSDIRICNLSLHVYYKNPTVKPPLPSDDTLRSLFRYDPDTGRILKEICGEWVVFDKDCVRNGIGYRQLNYGSYAWLSHRLIWLLHTGKWPEFEIDHKDRDGRNNRIGNLRDVTHVVNMRNRKIHKANKSGHSGVNWHKRAKKWYVTFSINGRCTSFGLYDDKEEAIRVRKSLEEKYW